MVRTPSDGVVEELLRDLDQLSRMLDTLGPTPFVIRSYVRTLFSILDAWAYHTKQKAYARGLSIGTSFSKKDFETIFERRLDATSSGTASRKVKTIPTSDNVKYAIQLWSRIHGGEGPPLGGELPPEFEPVRKQRNRITHPKVKADLAVVATDATNAGRVLYWLIDQMRWQIRLEIAYIDQLADHDKASSDALRREIESYGPTRPFRGSLKELYTAPKLKKQR